MIRLARLMPVFVVACLIAGALPAVAETYSFTANYQGPFAVAPVAGPPAGLNVSGTLTDPVAAFGLSTMDFAVFLNTTNTPNSLDNGTFTLSGPSGDKLFATYTGTAVGPGGDNIVNLTANYTITGGAGLFEGATGSGVWTGQANVATGHDVHVFHGDIVTPRAIPEPATLALMALGAASIWRPRSRRRG